jgi:hypothetical protein
MRIFRAAAWLLLLTFWWCGATEAAGHVHARHQGIVHLDSRDGDWDGHCDFCRHTLASGAPPLPATGPLPLPAPLRRPAGQTRACASHPAPAYAPLAARPPPS